MQMWNDAIRAGDTRTVVALLGTLTEADRRALAKELPGLLKELLAASDCGFLTDEVEPLVVAGAGTIGGAGATAAWLCRSDLPLGWARDRYAGICSILRAVTAGRPAEWRVDVAHRIAARLRLDAAYGRVQPLWHVAATLTTDAHSLADGFVIGWVTDGAHLETLADDPFLDALLPRLFETEGVGAALANEGARARRAASHTWSASLAALARTGRVDRTVLLDGCVRRFLRGGTAHTLRWFVQLHGMLEPTDDEAAVRARDYVRLLPAAPPAVADLALRAVRQADDLGRLDEALFEEAAAAVLFRPEKKLVRTALTWIDRTARKRDRIDASLRALTTAFTTDLRERAVRIAAKHAAAAGQEARERLRAEAAHLPADLRDTIAAVAGPVEARAAALPPSGAPPFVPRELPPPITSPSELAGELAVSMRDEPAWDTTERLLSGLVRLAFDDPGATREALLKVVLREDDRALHLANEHGWVPLSVRALLLPGRPVRLYDARAAFLKGTSWYAGTASTPLPHRFLAWRMREIASTVGKAPALLATPTAPSGHVDPGILVGRLELLEAAGVQPGRAELAQAMLRVPREIDPAAVTRAKGLASRAGQAVAAWLATGGDGRAALTSVTAASDIARICDLTAQAASQSPGNCGPVDWWPALLPSHREVTAAHLTLGIRTAHDAGARATVPALEAVAARGGSSVLVQEAARLHRILTSP
ncbi:DUF6493 family protein [Actinomadura rubrisoli]|uniref:DUF6493 domain-containing protein n=1 Tax=Actinomadura rubrisoli TaxID=2530368 RepID=A0A4V2YRU1_9ACTN|nr:DUF6493 family protein [Actinomadura rubrisoli]TDD67717.1 hypothetical protein E1298_39085 [Actinomadura rubrisoli]